MNESGEILSAVQLASSWLLKASSVFPKGGMSECYTIAEYWKDPSVGVVGGALSTLFGLAEFFGSPSFSEKATVLAHWMISQQLDCGGVTQGRTDEPVVPCVLQTGQAISGWLAAYRHTNDENFLTSAVYAGEWICAMQHGDTAWCSNLGDEFGGLVTAFTSRLAWPLLRLWEATGIERFKTSACSALDWLIPQRARNGWFMYNSMDDSSDATLNHISYCLEGLLYGGAIVDNKTYIAVVEQTVQALMQWQRANGEFSHKHNHSFRPVTPKNSAQSIAQMVCILFDLTRLTGNGIYAESAGKANAYLRSLQVTATSADVMRGAIPFERNARKFPVEAAVRFIDAQLIELQQVRQKVGQQ